MDLAESGAPVFDIHVTLVTEYDGCDTTDSFPTRYDFSARVPYHTPLLDSLREALPQAVQDNVPKDWLESGCECLEGQTITKRRRIDLHQTPVEIHFLVESLRNDGTPVLFLTDKKTSDSDRLLVSSESNASTLIMSVQERNEIRSLKNDRPTSLIVSPGLARCEEDVELTYSTSRAPITSDTSEVPRPLAKRQSRMTRLNTSPNFSIATSSIREQEDEKLSESEDNNHEETFSLKPLPTLGSDNDFLHSVLSVQPSVPSPDATCRTLTQTSSGPNTQQTQSGVNQKTPQRKAFTLRPETSQESSPVKQGAGLVGSQSSNQGLHHSISTPYLNILEPPQTSSSSNVRSFRARSNVWVGRERRRALRRRSTSLGDAMQPQQVTVHAESGETILTTVYDDSTTVGELRAAIDEELRQSTFFHKKLEAGFIDPRITVKYITPPGKEEKTVICRITGLTRVALDSRVPVLESIPSCTVLAGPDRQEVAMARRTLYEFVAKVAAERDLSWYAISPELSFSNTPITLSFRIPTSNMLSITLHFKDVFAFTRNVHIHTFANQILRDIFPCIVACGLVKDNVENFVLQVTGTESYIQGDFRIIYFREIREFIMKKEPIHLSVVKKPSEEYYLPFVLSHATLDPHTLNVPGHWDLAGKKLSSWDHNEKLKINITQVDNLGPREAQVHLDVSIHFGHNTLHQPLRSSVKDFVTSSAVWDQDMIFDISVPNIPREAKILVLLNDSTSGQHWGLISVFDSEGKIRHGKHTLNLWQNQEIPHSTPKKKRLNSQTSTEKQPQPHLPAKQYQAILAGSAVNNPAKSAIRVTLSFPKEYNLYYPSTSRNSRRSFWSQKNVEPNYRLRSNLINQVWKFLHPGLDREDYNELPELLLHVNWSRLLDRLEAYAFLENLQDVIKNIPIHVALRLLDSDFPDEIVRSFATAMLESLSDEDLQDYLLQLTQALKFESMHDSALTRFLLKRALNNKKIGHFFFWYLHAELQCLYLPRYAVILEAYLTGCGEAMLTRFKDQLEVQDVLLTVGQRLKDTYQKDGAAMQAELPTTLKSSNVDKRAFIPITNPSQVVGMMRRDKCKILPSAKLPMWLELKNMCRSAINPSPVRLIFKMGDDLRQDMITLRILALFDKLWKNEGLDLNLIPYGCMASGHRNGFIEVVKNAKTISEVSGIRESKKLLEWIKSHQKNEYGEVDSEKLKNALHTFIHSCAGYSVATYTLGIGDRHNDNIMITTSGNLFHIDFGHFLGNVKYYMGFKREWSPFVLTPDFIHVMGGEGSQEFELYRKLCCRAFQILRRNAELIINLFSLMRWTGIPELTCVEDTEYIRNALVLGKSDMEAEECFKKVIKKCIDLDWTVQMMWAIHKLKHGTTS